MTWAALRPELGPSAAPGEQGGHAQQEPNDDTLPVDPGHIRTRQHYEAMLKDQNANQ
ncbi:hypothetical protein [Janthinobacterium sp. SUN137]|uniref:hypothetical protein n=1 Tax=Janthinobacterium sp. SUN137 TaxID=3014789 RepID=UPI002712E122|nr:hypothetical protein [Janthinobacterium sp. SUN137]MDO8039469.1 hypothetical protein [Janthinobacterium sp. SUN137]